MLPAATAALLNARAFQLWAPGKMMEAVQERVLLSAERVPAFGSEVLNVLHTRFKEHVFSLAAVLECRRSGPFAPLDLRFIIVADGELVAVHGVSQPA